MTDEVVELMKKHGLKFRIDGARIFNAFAALNVLVKENLSEWNETDCFVALQEIVQKLKIDHKNSKTLAGLF
ncbi:hypothetical protein QVD17_31677 [Tagetes erecta]|uniref:Aromatic amino acid beta-eliminating lyase/threonine aldolase domain-containing protein n=1 Tax=Tagetes erecta TaxID=13708 RepID=A0AAD8K4Y5_TARER|nr:hypothetical protein QVD17_31677 [Tagetes erecta]